MQQTNTNRVGCVLVAGAVLLSLLLASLLTPLVGRGWAVGIGLILGVNLVEAARKELQRRRNDRRARAIHAEEELRKRQSEAREEAIHNVIADHLTTLRTKRAQLLAVDDYGIRDDSAWVKHRSYFIERVLPHKTGSAVEAGWASKLEDWIEGAIDAAERNDRNDRPVHGIVSLSGIEYERYCADRLRRSGWDVAVTKASGDQGVDLIARLKSFKAVVQCKRYAGSVGNAAVQEVLAAKAFEDGTHAVVVSNAPFTAAARALANKTGVLLLSHLQLDELETRLGADR